MAGQVLVCGGAVVDCIVKPFDASQRGASRTSLPGQAKVSNGGVARNIAEAIARLGGRPRLLSAVGDDDPGQRLRAATEAVGVDAALVAAAAPGGGRTATFTALLDGAGDLVGAVADMAIFDSISSAQVDAARAGGAFAAAALAVCDANLPPATLRRLLECSTEAGVPAWYEPVSVAKATRGLAGRPWHLATPNWDELQALLGRTPEPLPEASPADAGPLPPAVLEALSAALAAGVAERVLLTMGPRGVALAGPAGDAPPAAGRLRIDVAALLRGGSVPAPANVPPLELGVETLPMGRGSGVWYRLLAPLDRVEDTTGAGDALLAGAAAAFASGWPLGSAVLAGLTCAHATLFVEGAVAPCLDARLLPALAQALSAGSAGVAGAVASRL